MNQSCARCLRSMEGYFNEYKVIVVESVLRACCQMCLVTYGQPAQGWDTMAFYCWQPKPVVSDDYWSYWFWQQLQGGAQDAAKTAEP